MPVTLSSVRDLEGLGVDAIIDVRSPAEHAEDHLPGAINLPVLCNEERARVGTIYKQHSPFLARKIGAALVARNSAAHLEGPLAAMGGGWRPLVYCWRGGQRSGAFSTILSQVGWRSDTIAGGYKSWRRLVVEITHDLPFTVPVVVLDGNTGSAKTEVLARARARGAQVIDLEALANHRGSLFGAMPGGQPSQKAFEGRLAVAMAALDPSRPVLVEAESNRIGRVTVPKALWLAMVAAPRVTIEAPLPARAAYLAAAYADLTADRAALGAVLDKLRPFHAREVIEHWQGLAGAGGFAALAAELMAAHYDPRYAKARAQHRSAQERVVMTDALDAAALDRLADAVLAAAMPR
ncbi:MAG: tRNA 2-selenouridine(34) synthase MnmH [Defluviimonas sp.]|nr:tRNA 2-selenouridine(34) synthase MnmH [Defluviimonas sp.]